ncbi:acyl-CoA thioesterase II [Mycobacteroides chelonae]|uniref:acyl-CoA thioesterase II n=1 Tax=Mycobacteroides chelonae TaxID=1774 RepID=UPI00187752E3|nr:acyl-CoA thioesterase II [Mycobacteroides chelonae]MBV0916569.1 acyl-CoA thioesterase II [Mycobacteroides chelonae]
MSNAPDFAQLLALLELKNPETDLFIGGHPTVNPPRTFGGQLMAQSVVASGRTVSGKLSLAAVSTHFINGGDPEQDIEFRVLRLRDERNFANRRVDAVQGDLLLSSALVSYLKDSPGLEHAVKPPTVADPETLPTIDEHLVGYEETVPMFVAALKPIEWRYDNDPAWVLKAKSERLEHNRVWMKTHSALPDDPVLHSAALVYASDTTVLDSIITTHGLSWGYDRIFAATINHSVWFHRPVRFDDWVLYATESPVASAGRGTGAGRFFDREGALLASTIQEGIVKHFPGRS